MIEPGTNLSEHEVQTTTVDAPADKQRVADWVEEYNPEGVDGLTPWEGEQIGGNSGSDMPNLDAAKLHLVLRSASFSRLMAVVKSRLLLDYSNSEAMLAIQVALSPLATQSAASSALQSHMVDIQVAWDPVAFVKEQGYRSAGSLLTALVINGSALRCQLLPCLDYVIQVWPDIGESVMQAFVKLCGQDDTCASDQGTMPSIRRVKSTLPFRFYMFLLYNLGDSTGPFADRFLAFIGTLFDGTKVTIMWLKGELRMTCAGLLCSIRKVAEVVAWAGAALRQSSLPADVAYSVVKVHRIPFPEGLGPNLAIIKVGFDEERMHVENMTSGLCWQSMVRNPVVARGFPVPVRPNGTVVGLEVPLEVMSILVGAPSLAIFDTRVVMKGFNAAVVPTANVDSIFTWHLFVNKDGSRIPYSDTKLRAGLNLGLSAGTVLTKLQGGRHILGWTPKISYNIGMFNDCHSTLDLIPLTHFLSSRFPLVKLRHRMVKSRLRWCRLRTRESSHLCRPWLFEGRGAIFYWS